MKFILILSTVFLVVSPAKAAVDLIPVTIGEAKSIFSADVFARNEERAAKAGIILSNQLDAYAVKGEGNGQAFLLFYNYTAAPNCGRDYLIQKVKLTKSEFNESGMETSRTEQYLVEVLKIKNGRTKKPDEHVKLYKIGQSDRRHLSAEYQIGCGEIPGSVEGNAWPREGNTLYWLVQDYSDASGVYFNVRYDDSTSYRYEMDHDAQGILNITLPNFIPR